MSAAALLADPHIAELHRQLVELEDPHARALIHVELGRLALRLGDRRRAVQHFQEALTLHPSLTEARHWLTGVSPSATPPATGWRRWLARRR